MTSDPTPTEQAAGGVPNSQPQHEGATHKRPLVWMILAGVAVAAAIGLGIWAIVLNDDLNDTEAQLEAQAAAAESASAEAESRIADARASIDDSLSGIAGIVVVSDEDVAEAEQAVADAEQSVAEAQAAVDQAQSEVEQARAERDLARAEAEQARAEAAKAELCADASLAATQALSENDDTAAAYEEAAARARDRRECLLLRCSTGCGRGRIRPRPLVLSTCVTEGRYAQGGDLHVVHLFPWAARATEVGGASRVVGVEHHQ